MGQIFKLFFVYTFDPYGLPTIVTQTMIFFLIQFTWRGLFGKCLSRQNKSSMLLHSLQTVAYDFCWKMNVNRCWNMCIVYMCNI